MQVRQAGRAPVGLRRLHQGLADLQAQVVALRVELGHRLQETPPGGADVEVEGEGRIGEEGLRWRQGARLQVNPAEGVDVLAHHQRTETRNPQLAV